MWECTTVEGELPDDATATSETTGYEARLKGSLSLLVELDQVWCPLPIGPLFRVSPSALYYCAVLYCTILYCAVLCCTVRGTVRYCATGRRFSFLAARSNVQTTRLVSSIGVLCFLYSAVYGAVHGTVYGCALEEITWRFVDSTCWHIGLVVSTVHNLYAARCCLQEVEQYIVHQCPNLMQASDEHLTSILRLLYLLPPRRVDLCLATAASKS